jgi:hypothetical protein
LMFIYVKLFCYSLYYLLVKTVSKNILDRGFF